MIEGVGVPVTTPVLVVVIKGWGVSVEVWASVAGGVNVRDEIIVFVGVQVFSFVTVKAAEGVEDGIGVDVGDKLGCGDNVTVSVIVRRGLNDGITSAEGVDVIVSTEVADSVGIILAVTEGDGRGLSVIVADGSWVGEAAWVGGDRSSRPGET